MIDNTAFRKRVDEALAAIGADTLTFDQSEFWMIKRGYRYIENYANEKQLYNTAVALPLVRALHNGTYRKGTVLKDGAEIHPPYVIHCLMVCRMLINLQMPLSHEDEDIVLASALCHDIIEDIPFADGGREIYTLYGLDPRVYETVRLVSKRRDFTPEEHEAYFHGIAADPLALLVKLSDRGNNVEDLYNMKIRKIHEYIDETRAYFIPMCDYGKLHFEQLRPTIFILREKIETLIRIAEILADRFAYREQQLRERLDQLLEENARLKSLLNGMEDE